ncbi:MAG TPA: PH domain-containing protein [Gemmataceae bacterium]
MAAETLTYRCPHCHAAVEVEPHSGSDVVHCPQCNRPFHPEVPSVKPESGLVVPTEAEARRESEARREDERPVGERPRPPRPEELPEQQPDREQTIAKAGKTPERELLRFSPAMFRRFPGRVALYLLLVVVGVAGVVYGLTGQGWFWWVAGLALALIAGGRLLWWWHRNRSTDVTLTNKRIVIRQGAWKEQSTEVLAEDISDVFVSQSTFQSLMNVGDILVKTAGAETRRVILMGVVQPERVAQVIRNREVEQREVT